MKTFDKPMRMLVATLFGLGSAASAMAANGSRVFALMGDEYNEAVSRADRDYETANRRCELLKIDERNLCRRDSLLVRRAAVVEAEAQRILRGQSSQIAQEPMLR
jgi:hypothetical protein